jgi:hypothetical protein
LNLLFVHIFHIFPLSHPAAAATAAAAFSSHMLSSCRSSSHSSSSSSHHIHVYTLFSRIERNHPG